MIRRIPPVSRRQVLRFLAHGILALPLRRVLSETRAFGAGASRRRVVFFFFPDGIIRSRFHPTDTGRRFTLPQITAPLEAVRDDIVLLKNVNYATGGSHEGGAAYCLTGIKDQGPGVSLDTILGEELKEGALIPAARLGVGANFQAGKAVSYFAPGAAAAIEDHPLKAFLSYFGQGTIAEDPATRQKIASAEQSLLDFALADLGSLRNQLGTIERQKLDTHLEALRELERRAQNLPPLSQAGGAACPKPLNQRGLKLPINDDQYPPAIHRNEIFGEVGEVMTELAVQALACGVTNVLYLQWSHPVSPTVCDFQGGPGIARGHHDLSHYSGDENSASAQDFAKSQAWFMERLASLIQQMKAIREGDESLLASSTVLALTEIADGNLHDFTNVGLVLAGQGGGSLKTGRSLDAAGASHNQILVSVAHSAGVTAINSVGDPSLGTGPLKALFSE